MDTRTLTATTESAGARLDAFLAARLPDLTRSAAARLIEGGLVTVDGKPAGKSARLTGGETVSVTLPQAEEPEAQPQDIPLEVVYEDADVIVVNKPVGMVVHPAPGHPDGTLVNALLHHCGGQPFRHRRRSCAPASSTASTGTPAASSSPPKTTPPTPGPGRPAFRTIPWPGRTSVGGRGQLSGGQRHRGRPHRPPPAPTGRKWPWCRNGRRAVTHWEVLARYQGYHPPAAAGWKQAAPTRSGYTWPISATPSWGTRCTGPKSPCRV